MCVREVTRDTLYYVGLAVADVEPGKEVPVLPGRPVRLAHHLPQEMHTSALRLLVGDVRA